MTPHRLIGLSEEEARILCEHYNFRMQVAEEDGEFYFCTSQHDENNIYVRIYEGVITDAF